MVGVCANGVSLEEAEVKKGCLGGVLEDGVKTGLWINNRKGWWKETGDHRGPGTSRC